MTNPTLRDRFRNSMQYMFFWLAVRKDVPKDWFKGGYSLIKLARFSLVIIALLNFAAVALGSPNWNAQSPYTLWVGFASAAYILIAIVYLLGLRSWYGPAAAFLIVSAFINYGFNSAGGPDPLSPITAPNFNDIIMLTSVYLIVVGLAMMRYDKGSKLNALLLQS